MTQAVFAPPLYETFGEFQAAIGDVPPERVRLWPYAGTATEEDMLASRNRFNGLFELLDGVLVERTYGFREALLVSTLVSLIFRCEGDERRWLVFGVTGPVRITPTRVRLPDVVLYDRSRFAQGAPKGQIMPLAPDIVADCFRDLNTEREMAIKRQEYLDAGTAQVWHVYPESRTVRVYSRDGTPLDLTEADTLDGGNVLPGLRVSIGEWFTRAWRT